MGNRFRENRFLILAAFVDSGPWRESTRRILSVRSARRVSGLSRFMNALLSLLERGLANNQDRI